MMHSTVKNGECGSVEETRNRELRRQTSSALRLASSAALSDASLFSSTSRCFFLDSYNVNIIV